MDDVIRFVFDWRVWCFVSFFVSSRYAYKYRERLYGKNIEHFILVVFLISFGVVAIVIFGFDTSKPMDRLGAFLLWITMDIALAVFVSSIVLMLAHGILTYFFPKQEFESAPNIPYPPQELPPPLVAHEPTAEEQLEKILKKNRESRN